MADLLESLRLTFEVGRSAYIRSRPFLLYFKPTSRCDLRCGICSRWRSGGAAGGEMPLPSVKRMLEKFRDSGFSILTLWGGEPLLRKELPEILEGAKALGFRTSLCTNCAKLERRAGEILPHLDVLLCSLDGYGEVHDEMRGSSGLFDAAVRGIEIASKYEKCDTKIWATVHAKNLGQVEKLAFLARNLGVGIEFFPVSPIPGYNEELLPGAGDLFEAFGIARRLKREGLPVRNPDRVLEVMQEGRAFDCNFGKIAIHLDHAGKVYSCEDPEGTPLHPWGGWEDIDCDALFAAGTFRKAAADLKRCNRCRLPCVVQLSGNLAGALAGMFLQFMTGSKGRGGRGKC